MEKNVDNPASHPLLQQVNELVIEHIEELNYIWLFPVEKNRMK